MQWILPLESANLTHIASVGGKAARLGALAQAGFDVPAGLVIPSSAFISHLPNYATNERPPAPRLASEFMNAVANAVGQRFEADTLLAVRSSAIDEDGYGASFAGQHATYYYIAPAELDRAIVDCWLSLWTDAAITYRARWEEPPGPMAVIIQRMVAADRSGVAFSRNPAEPSDQRTVVEATWGLGAALVDGRVTPDRLMVDHRGRIGVEQVGDKRVQVPPTPEMAQYGRLADVAEHLRRERTLSDRQAREVAETTEQIEALFGHPVDVEWAYEGDRLNMLQARPITTTLTSEAQSRPLVLFKPLAENFSEPLTPLSEDLFRQVLPKIGDFVRGRFYLDFNRAKAWLPFRLDDAGLADMLLLKRTDAPPLSPLKLIRTTALLSLAYICYGIFWHRSAHVGETSLDPLPAMLERYRKDPNMDPPSTLRRLLQGRAPFQPLYRAVFQLNMSSGRYFMLHGALKALLGRWAPRFDQDLVPSLCYSGTDMASTRMVEAIGHLAVIARTHDDAASAMEQPEPLQALARLAPEHPFTVGLSDFLLEFGHRGSREVELAAPRWREDVGALLPMVRSQMARPSDAVDRAYAQHLGARDQLHQALSRRWQRRVVDHLVRRIRYYVALRENTRHAHTRLFELVRHKIKAVENELIAKRALNVQGDIFFLHWEEVTALQAGTLDAVSASQLVRERRIQWQASARQAPPDRINVARTPSNDDESVLTGTCACPGQVQGTARVVMSPSEADVLQPGDILVAPYTDPTWTPLFPGLGGIVVGVGSYLSHAGTIAREYQVPCLVDVNGATELIQDGARLHLDASAGTASVLGADR